METTSFEKKISEVVEPLVRYKYNVIDLLHTNSKQIICSKWLIFLESMHIGGLSGKAAASG